MTEGRPGPFFRGGELRGLIAFVVIVAVGWPVILNYARPKAEPPAPPTVDPRPLEPDTSLAFRGLIDKTPVSTRDNAAYKALLDRARETPPETLAKDARRDVFYTHLWERPDLYRGVPIHLEGILKKVVPHEKVNPVFSAKGKLIDAWFITPESRPLPYVVAVEDAPPGLPVGIELNERVAVDGYFLKLLRYLGGDTERAAPLLVGRLRRLAADGTPVAPGAPAPAADAGKRRWNLTVAAVLGALGVYVAIRLAFQVRRVMAPSARRPSFLSPDRPAEHIAPEALADWLANVPDEDEGHAPERSP